MLQHLLQTVHDLYLTMFLLYLIHGTKTISTFHSSPCLLSVLFLLIKVLPVYILLNNPETSPFYKQLINIIIIYSFFTLLLSHYILSPF